MSKRILIAEADLSARVLLKRILTQAGYEVQLAGSASQAVYQFVVRRPDLILFDLSLPDEHGWEPYELMHRFRALRPVILLCGDAGERQRAMSAGLALILDVPVQADEVLESVYEVLEGCGRPALAPAAGDPVLSQKPSTANHSCMLPHR